MVPVLFWCSDGTAAKRTSWLNIITGDNATITAYASPFPTKPYGLCGDPENKDDFKPTSVRIKKNKQQPNGYCLFLVRETGLSSEYAP